MNVSATNKAYLAGYFDGEGAVMVKVTQRKTMESVTVNVAASQKYGTGLELFKQYYKGNVYGPFKGDVYMWKANGWEAYKFLQEVLPWLTVKKPKAIAAIQAWDSHLHRSSQNSP